MSIQDLIQQFSELKEKIRKIAELLKIEDKKIKFKALEIEMSGSDFWDDQERARVVSQTANDLKEEIEKWEKIKKEVNDLLELAENKDEELEDQLKKELEKKEKEFFKMEFFVLFFGKYDKNNAILSIHAGTGGVDAQDWAEMLLRMYLRFCENKKWKINIVDKASGNEAGIKSVTIHIKGKNAYGFLKSEAGTHRLVRISPFDAEKMRHTSFALVEILPEFLETNKIKIKDDDLKIETFKSSGHGGQGVNTTDSAVRIVHIPSKITVVCRNERSQLQNKETALKILQAKLLANQEQEKKQEQKELKGEIKKAEWGAQIRSYVLQPYKMVKDHRTKFETQEVDKVLDGEIDGFIEEYLKFLKK
ncbi:MAG: peptide chain release factor 2 [Patescibacteria group bacterium]|nr:peptide chain release factor 2 [Patescibacteria group bacterium]